MKFFIICSYLFLISTLGYSQELKDFTNAEHALITVYSKITRFAKEEDNIANNNRFIVLLDSILKIPESFNYTFTKLQMGIVEPRDRSFRIFSWNIIHTDGTYENFGFIQKYNKNGTVKVYFLKDKSKTLKNQMLLVCSPDTWIGATYYSVCQNKYDDETYYTLLGWSPNSTFTQKKIIEVLKFDKTGMPSFGFPIVELKGKGFQRRIIFEYSSKNSMMMRYDKRKKMIVFDHLAPSDFRYNDIYEFYGPDFSIDGYKFKKGKWRYQSDIDIRNPRNGIKDYLPIRYFKNLLHIESNVEQ